MEDLNELIRRYGLEEDEEHIIIPLPDSNGSLKRCYLLKREFIRIVYADGRYSDYPLARVVEAIVRYPELLLSEALYLLYKDLELQMPHLADDETEGPEV